MKGFLGPYCPLLLLLCLFFFITIYVAKHTYYEIDFSENEYKQPLKIWHIILYFIVYMIPLLNVCAFFTGFSIYIINITSNYITFKFNSNDNLLEKISNWLNKNVN